MRLNPAVMTDWLKIVGAGELRQSYLPDALRLAVGVTGADAAVCLNGKASELTGGITVGIQAGDTAGGSKLGQLTEIYGNSIRKFGTVRQGDRRTGTVRGAE